MSKPVRHTAKSLTEFTRIVETALARSKKRHQGKENAPEIITNWYRGVGSAKSHKLVPSLYRHPEGDVEVLLEMERRMMSMFKRRSVISEDVREIDALAAKDDEVSRLSLLFYMQHYRVPTRLLDWTENPYIGLYFALSSARFDAKKRKFTEAAAVWILDPIAWNKKALHADWGSSGSLSLDDELVKGYAPPQKAGDPLHEDPAATQGTYNNRRIAAQRGVFTIFGKSRLAMEDTCDSNNYPAETLHKVEIAASNIEQLLETIISMGFTDSSTYPDFHGLAMEIRRNFGFDV